MRENCDLLKKHGRKSKPGWEIRVETQIKKLRKQVKGIKQRKDTGICRNKREKATQKNNNTTWGNKQKSIWEWRNIKGISKKGKTIQTKRDIKKKNKEISINNLEEMTRKHTNIRMQRETKRFGTKIWQPKNNEKAKWINNITRELEGLKENPKAEIHIDLLKMTQKLQTRKRLAMLVYMVSGSRNSVPFTTD